MLRNVLVGLVAMLPLALFATPAHAYPGGHRLPLRCGMVVSQDAYVYLEKDLYCRGGVGVRVEDSDPADNYFPSVTVDLQGHTLRGPKGEGFQDFAWDGLSFGISAYHGTSRDGRHDEANLRVINGRVENWTFAIMGQGEVVVRRVKLVNNWWGVSCGHLADEEVPARSRCDVGSAYVARNYHGLLAAGTAVVKHSRFSGNVSGAMFRSTAVVERSTFKGPADYVAGGIYAFPRARVQIRYGTFVRAGVESFPDGEMRVWRSFFTGVDPGAAAIIPVGKITESTFLNNDVAVVGRSEGPGNCLELVRVRFIGNKTNILGQHC